MASIKQTPVFNMPEDGKLGFRQPQSDPQFNWRNNPNLAPCRELVRNTIGVYLAQNASGAFAQEITMLAGCLESQLFLDAFCEDDYMDQEKLLDRLQSLISQRWFEAGSAQQEEIDTTASLPIYASAPTLGMLNSNLSPNLDKVLDDPITSANAARNLASAPNLLADVQRSSICGSQKCTLDTTPLHHEFVLQDRHFSGVGFSNAESSDSATTYSGSVLQYDSEASFESHRYKSHNLFKGETNLAMSSDRRFSSVHTSAMVWDNLKCEVPTVSDDMHMHQQVTGPLQFEQKLSCLESHGDGHLREINSLGSLFVQRRNLHAFQGATSTSSNIRQRSSDNLLCYYITYNYSARKGLEVPFLEYLHSEKCKGGICCCDEYKLLLSHYDNCGSADCSICGPAVRICSANGLIQPGLRESGVGSKGLTFGSNCGKRVRANPSEDLMNPAKSRKFKSSPDHGSSSGVSALTEEPFSPLGPFNSKQTSICLVTDSIASSGANVEISTSHTASRSGEYDDIILDDVLRCKPGGAINISENSSADFQQKAKSVSIHVDDATKWSQDSNNNLHDIQGSDSGAVTTLLNDTSADFCQQEIEPAIIELKGKFRDGHYELPSDSVSSFCKDKSIAHNVEIIQGSAPKGQLNIIGEGFPPTVASWTGMMSEKQTVEGISLIDFFTPEEIRQHISSLRQKVEQGTVEEIVEYKASCSVSENTCQLCVLDKLEFSPMPIYCSSCGGRVKNHATYYSTKDDNCAQFCFCTSCYYKCPRGNITLHGLSIPKSSLETKKNNLVTVESWVQCDRCERWQHQICALFNDKKDLGGKAEYLCPMCYLEDLEIRGHMPLPRPTSLNASNLPQTLLSDHLEQRLLRCLKQERENRGKAAGDNPEEVLQPADLVVRVVSCVDKKLQVKQQFLDIFPEKSYPAEFPYRSKVILLFQRIEGVDVCLFAMYVQEFGSDCSQPNQRCVYISYLDSVKYFRPEAKTGKGEALRTLVYHEILVGYLDYCKNRGFATCYIWACPPVKGEDYILYCHPETQKTPKPDKLRQWYQSMLKKATEEKVVVNFSNLYEKFFVPAGESNVKVTAARLPYFDGDYWSSVAENMIKKIELESGGDPQKQVKKMTRRSLKAMGHINPSADDAKDILLMQALGQNISSAKEDFIIVYLHFICTHCHEVILSGKRWFCSQCKNYQLCGRCQDADQQSGLGNTHISSGGQTHALSQELVNDVPLDTEDNDSILDNCFLENRHAFLSFCQGNHYQFDSLRRAKHSSMMILYHLQNPNGSNDGTVCSLCFKDTGVNHKWICERCPEFSVCSLCYQRNDASCHNHTLVQHLPTAIRGRESKMTEMIKQLLDVLVHASQCQTAITHPCSYPNCTLLRRLFCHAHACGIRVSGGCRHCKKAWFILFMHSRTCRDSNCHIPRCMDLKNHAKGLKLESKTLGKNIVLSDVCTLSAIYAS